MRPRHLAAVAACVVSTTIAGVDPGSAWVGLVGIICLAWAARFFAPLTALIACGLIVLYGSAGQANYLGLASIQPSTVASAIVVLSAMSLGIFLGSGAGMLVKRTHPRLVTPRMWIALALAAILILLARLSGGVPLLAGDAARLESVANVSPVLGLLSGVLPIVVAYLPTRGSRTVLVLKVTVALLVLATASRLLLAAVLLGFLIRSEWFGRMRGFRARALLVAALAIVTFAVLRVYSIRTDEAIVESMASRTLGVDGAAGFLNSILGPSIFFGARNGLVVFELSNYSSLTPPGGFIFGGLANALAVGNDPERWLTQALGLDVLTTGAVATPIWAGSVLDFGTIGGMVFALTAGLLIGLWLRSTPEIVPWLSFGIVLSAYGSYLVSAQFVAASLLLTALLAVFGRQDSSDTAT